ncbi:MAG: hypothetical protein NC319_01945, partial [Butyricicoccus sp.]|nr:hypothetical protein [Butyricicoccus sp.]
MKRDYISRLAFLARWRFPAEEAEDIISDYREMVANEPGTDAELVQRFGTPWAALRQIKSGGVSRLWLAEGALSFACLIVPAAWVLWKNVNQLFWWLFLEKQADVPLFLLGDSLGDFLGRTSLLPVLLILGLVSALLLFRHGKKDKPPLTRAMALTMAALLLLLAGLWCVILKMLCDFDGFIQLVSQLNGARTPWAWIRGVCFG